MAPQLRPNCDKILEMPSVKKRIERYFPEDQFYDSQTSLLNTIRVPKNLLYLTDRLPKPNYNSASKKEEQEKLRRKTFDPGQQTLPDISSSQKTKNGQHLPPVAGTTGKKKKADQR